VQHARSSHNQGETPHKQSSVQQTKYTQIEETVF